MILQPGMCPNCNSGMLRRGFGWSKAIFLVLFIFLFFPFGLLIFFSPDYLFCRNCGARFD